MSRPDRRGSALRVSFMPEQQEDRRRLSLPQAQPYTSSHPLQTYPKMSSTVNMAYSSESPARPSHLSHQSKMSDNDIPLAYHANRKSSILEGRRGSVLTERRLSHQNLITLARYTHLTPAKGLLLFVIVFSATYLASLVPLPKFKRDAAFLKPPAEYYRPPPQPFYAHELMGADGRLARAKSSSGAHVAPVQAHADDLDLGVATGVPEGHVVAVPRRQRAGNGKARMASLPARKDNREAQAPPSRPNRPGQGSRPGMAKMRPGARAGAGVGAIGRPHPVLDSSDIMLGDDRRAGARQIPSDRRQKVMAAPAAPPPSSPQKIRHVAVPPTVPVAGKTPVLESNESEVEEEPVGEAEDTATEESGESRAESDDDSSTPISSQDGGEDDATAADDTIEEAAPAVAEKLRVVPQEPARKAPPPPPGGRLGLQRRPAPAGAPPRRFKRPQQAPEDTVRRVPSRREKGRPRRGASGGNSGDDPSDA